MRLYTKDIKIGHPAVPWIIAKKLGHKPYIFQIQVALKTHIGIIEDGLNIEFNDLSYDVMGELMVKFDIWPQLNWDKSWSGVSTKNGYRETPDWNFHKTPQEAVAMCVIRMKEYYDIPDELNQS